jgi:hypothetical protein
MIALCTLAGYAALIAAACALIAWLVRWRRRVRERRWIERYGARWD